MQKRERAFYPVGTNVIVMNKIPLERIKETRPELYKPYIFHASITPLLPHYYLIQTFSRCGARDT
ncbi:MAG: hypothetical protein D4R88_04115 [Methanosarcinales archaeon]|nr:MAG: hypothetical protein D4R88_04115 [Methanosarcinales archaeon]